MRVDLFDFDLPEELIALRPASPRDSARLLCVDKAGRLSDRVVTNLPDLLRPGDALVFNDTRVIPARLSGVRLRGDGAARVEATLHMRLDADRWKAFLRPAKKVRIGETIRFDGDAADSRERHLEAMVAEKGEAGEVDLIFNRAGPALDAALYAVGHMPLPPYIASKRGEDKRDARDYQTVYARKDGAVAAPTAGLHFTDALLKAIEERGVESHFLTLHVGAGTFLPVKSKDTEEHKMHAEIGHVSGETAEALNAVRARGGRIVSVGTTSLRLLESAADTEGNLHAWSGATDIFITPEYRFRFVDALMTNFHLPRSTLFMLVCAFSGYDTMRAAYGHAIAKGYRFYSYGDSSLLWRAEDAQ